VKEVERMYKTILVPLDGSKRAEKILPHVEALARRFAAHVLLLQVVEAHPIDLFAEAADSIAVLGQIEKRTHEAQRYLAGIQADLLAKTLRVTTRVEYGPVVAIILDVAEREGVDLIALASHGRTGLARVFYGSVAAGLLHRVDHPLLIIRAQDEEPGSDPSSQESSPQG
jgi:nucleotide-binding universal stress UspA family protein